MSSNCPLCANEQVSLFLECEKPFLSRYYQCDNCHLIFTDREFLLNQSIEKSRYDFHENNIEDEGYVNFLARLIGPVQKYIDRNQFGLDYGSGPEPVLMELMKKDGFEMDIFDPIYSKKELTQNYDFITSTEVVEHFHNPKESFDHMLSHLKPGGILAIMTSIYDESINFKQWHYRYDDTHVAFYSDKTFHWLLNHYSLELVESKNNVRIFRKTIS